MPSSTILFTTGFGLFILVSYSIWLMTRINRAKAFIRGRERIVREGSLQAAIDREPPSDQASLTGALVRYEFTFDGSLSRRLLQSFSVENAAAPVYRAAALSSGMLRPLSGWLLLVGLIITLWNLQAAVGLLSGAFREVAVPPSASSSLQNVSPTQARSSSAHDREHNVTDKMANMAGAASYAFSTSLCCIFLALTSMILAVVVDARAKTAVIMFERWADDLFQLHLPSQLPVTEGDFAKRLTENADSMTQVVSELRNAAAQLSNLTPLMGAMSGATDAIQDAMRQLPKDLRDSMTNVSADLIRGLTSTLGESNEYTKRILMIYAEQELRVRGIDAVLKSVQSSLNEIKEAHHTLSVLPEQNAQVVASAFAIQASTEVIKLTAERISHLVELLPVSDLKDAIDALLGASISLEECKKRLDVSNVELRSLVESQRKENPNVSERLEELSRYLARISGILDASSSAAKRAYAENIRQLILDRVKNEGIGAADPAIRTLLLQIEAQVRAVHFENSIYDVPADGDSV